MMGKSLLVSSLVALVSCSIIGIQADIVTYKACTESTYDGPLKRIQPTKYGMIFAVDEQSSSTIVSISAKANDSNSINEEPKDMIIVDADESVTVDTIGVLKKQLSFPFLTLPVFIDTVCQYEQLLVIKLKGEIEDRSELMIIFTGKSPIRTDGKGIHKEENTIKASFGQSEARLAIPCIDLPEYKTVFQIGLATSDSLVASSDVCHKADERHVFGRTLVRFSDTRPISFDELSFELKPKNNPIQVD